MSHCRYSEALNARVRVRNDDIVSHAIQSLQTPDGAKVGGFIMDETRELGGGGRGEEETHVIENADLASHRRSRCCSMVSPGRALYGESGGRTTLYRAMKSERNAMLSTSANLCVHDEETSRLGGRESVPATKTRTRPSCEGDVCLARPRVV